MKPDKLENLFNTFMKNRTKYDVVDGPLRAVNHQAVDGYMQAEIFEGPDLTQPGGFLFGAVSASGVSQSDPTQPGGFLFGAVAESGFLSPPVLPADVNSNQLIALGRQLADLAANFAANRPECSPIRFEKSCIIVAPEEQIVTISVVSLDNFRDKECRVKWKTCDKTAFSGTHYVESSGELLFRKGDDKKSFQIKILSSSSDSVDLRFGVQMSIVDSGFDPNPMTVSLKDLSVLYPEEVRVVKNIQALSQITVEDVRSYLQDSLTSRTFHIALTHLCSTADSVPLEFALAFDLSRLCISKLPSASVLRILQDYFRGEDID